MEKNVREKCSHRFVENEMHDFQYCEWEMVADWVGVKLLTIIVSKQL